MPDISVVLLSWDGLELTTRCVESLRAGTESELELIIVDNGSAPRVQEAVVRLADRSVVNGENLGFAVGMNQGLEIAEAPRVVFANNDTVFPPGWDRRLVETLEAHPEAGLVVPAVTAAGNRRTVRVEEGTQVERLLPFTEPPSGVVYLMDTDLCRSLGGWTTEYRLASAEDWDLCFTLWVNGLEIYYDSRVLIEHVSKGTAGEKLDDWQSLWRENRNRFLTKWSGDVSHLVLEPTAETARRQEQLEVVVGWMRHFYHTRDELLATRADLADRESLLKRQERSIHSLRDQASLAYQLRRLPARAIRKARHLWGRLPGQRRSSPSDPATTVSMESRQ